MFYPFNCLFQPPLVAGERESREDFGVQDTECPHLPQRYDGRLVELATNRIDDDLLEEQAQQERNYAEQQKHCIRCLEELERKTMLSRLEVQGRSRLAYNLQFCFETVEKLVEVLHEPIVGQCCKTYRQPYSIKAGKYRIELVKSLVSSGLEEQPTAQADRYDQDADTRREQAEADGH